MNRSRFRQQSTRLRRRLWVYLANVLVATSLLFSLSDARATESPERTLVVYLAGTDQPTLNRQITEMLGEALGDKARVIPYQPGQIAQDSDKTIVVSLGSEALTRVRQENRDARVISLLAPDHLLSSYASRTDSHVTGIYRDAPLLRQALTGRVILPHSSRVAMLATPETAVLYDSLLDKLPDHGMEGKVFVVSQSDRLIPTLIRALNYGDFLLAGPDQDIYNPRTIKHILLTTYRRNRIVIGPDQAYVKAGSLASSYATLKDMVDKSAEFILHFGKFDRLPDPVHPDQFAVAVNRQVARSLNIPVPSNEQIVRDIQSALTGRGEATNGR